MRELAEQDLGNILGDADTGFGWPIIIDAPSGNSAPFTGYSNDISQMIDPDTGQLVAGRMASVAIRISALLDIGFGLPRGVADSNSKPWVVTFSDINGNEFVFKVKQANPDRALGLITCNLEAYEP